MAGIVPHYRGIGDLGLRGGFYPAPDLPLKKASLKFFIKNQIHAQKCCFVHGKSLTSENRKLLLGTHMAFRANETSNSLIQDAQNYLIGRDFPKELRPRAIEDFGELVSRYGPVVKGYPTWHPLMAACNDNRQPWTHPQNNRAYDGLDHVLLFRDAFLVCPYSGADRIIKSVRAMRDPNHHILAEELDMKLYNPNATPVLVYHEWRRPLLNDGTIPKSLAVPLMLEFEIPHWRSSEVGETWETMRSYLLGSPHGQSSSLFINKDTGTVMKNVWNSLIYTGMFGSLYVG